MAMVTVFHWECRKEEQVEREWWMHQLCVRTGRRDVLRTTGALGVQLASTGVQRLECRPAEPAPGFDPNLSATCHAGSWRVTGTETWGDHAPEGATFAGRQDLAIAWNEHTLGT